MTAQVRAIHLFLKRYMTEMLVSLEKITKISWRVRRRSSLYEAQEPLRHAKMSVWNNKLQNANKGRISPYLQVVFNFNWFIIYGNCVFKLSLLPQPCWCCVAEMKATGQEHLSLQRKSCRSCNTWIVPFLYSCDLKNIQKRHKEKLQKMNKKAVPLFFSKTKSSCWM